MISNFTYFIDMLVPPIGDDFTEASLENYLESEFKTSLMKQDFFFFKKGVFHISQLDRLEEEEKVFTLNEQTITKDQGEYGCMTYNRLVGLPDEFLCKGVYLSTFLQAKYFDVKKWGKVKSGEFHEDRSVFAYCSIITTFDLEKNIVKIRVSEPDTSKAPD